MTIHDHAGQPYEADLIEGEKFRELERENARMREFIDRISKQRPSRPDYWSTCSQCDRNIGDAQDVLTSPTP